MFASSIIVSLLQFELFSIWVAHLVACSLLTSCHPLNSDFINKHSDIWDKTKLKYDFMDDEIDLDGAVYYTRAVIRDLLQRNGMDMHDNIAHQNKRKVYKI